MRDRGYALGGQIPPRPIQAASVITTEPETVAADELLRDAEMTVGLTLSVVTKVGGTRM